MTQDKRQVVVHLLKGRIEPVVEGITPRLELARLRVLRRRGQASTVQDFLGETRAAIMEARIRAALGQVDVSAHYRAVLDPVRDALPAPSAQVFRRSSS